MPTLEGDVTVKGVIFRFVRRRYNGRKTFTWLHWLDENEQWQAYGDPWPSVTIPHKDLERIADELRLKVAPEIEMYEVCEMFDVKVMQDYWGGTDEHPEAGHSLFSLGQHAELSAGLRGFRLSPWFQTMGDLEQWCQRNIGRFREWIKSDPDGPAPDATNWS
jgi:hypothetical protein